MGLTRAIAFVTLYSAALANEIRAGNHGYKSSLPWMPREFPQGAVPAEQLVAEESLPKAFDWRDVNGKSYAVVDWNQHIPQYCGACWVHGTLSALNDRIKVFRGAKYPDVMLGRQAIINCVPSADGQGPPPGCDGGDAYMIHKYMHENKVPDESCLPYQARNMGCEAANVCRNCLPGTGGCWSVNNWIGYGVSSFGNVSGEVAMMKEIYARGPIACSFATDGAFMLNYSENALRNEGVYVTDQKYNESQIDHVMEVAGWGETPSGLKYWVIRNSWGTFWGNAGWLKLRRGVNQMLSESECDWAVPTFDDLDEALDGRVMGDYMLGLMSVNEDGKVDPVGPVNKVTAAPAAAGGGGAGPTASAGAGDGMGRTAGAFVSGAAVTLLAVRLAAGRRRSLKEQSLLG